MSSTHEELVHWLAKELRGPSPVADILERAPDLSLSDAYGIQRALGERWAAAGDRIIGYKAALTSRAMQAREGIDEPLLGTLLQSRLHEEDTPVSLVEFLQATLEPEVGVLLRSDLAGPGVTRLDALAAIAGYFPCVEIGDIRAASDSPSMAHVVACNTFNGGQIFGQPLVSPAGIDLRLEGVVLSVNGEVRGSATAVEVLGDPVNVVVHMANKLAELGVGLHAGQVLMTGSIVASVAVAPGDDFRVDFTRLGGVRGRFVA